MKVINRSSRYKKNALSKLMLLGATFALLIMLSCVSYRLQSQPNGGDTWRVHNAPSVSWYILVRDAATGEQAQIQPGETAIISRGSDVLEVNSDHDQFTFNSSASRVTITEPFKGQLTLIVDDEVCPCDDEQSSNGNCLDADCRFCQCNK